MGFTPTLVLEAILNLYIDIGDVALTTMIRLKDASIEPYVGLGGMG